MFCCSKKRPGNWLKNHSLLEKWVSKLKARVTVTEVSEYHFPVRMLYNMVANDPLLDISTQGMFVEALHYDKEDPTSAPAVKTWKEFLDLLNALMTTAPEFIVDAEDNEAQGLVGFPINALIDWPMGTSSGYYTFANVKFNRYFKDILQYWSAFLSGKKSRYVLAEGDDSGPVHSIPWFSDPAKQQMVEVALQPFDNKPDLTFEEIFDVPDAEDEKYLGFKSWDDFFIRRFREGQRPVGEAEIVNACESAPLQYKTGVRLSADIMLKGQPYSLRDMLNDDSLALQFAGGTVYQAYLSALSYHCWHSPVDGVIEKTYIVDGTFYLQSPSESVYSNSPDPAAPNESQPFITSVATRGIIFIRADNPAIGMIAMVAVGMAEVSSCEITVVAGQDVKKGDDIGMFHFGGSTHCLVFEKGVELDFKVPVTQEPNLSSTNVAVKADLATVVSK